MANDPANLSFQFRAAPADLETLEAAPACVSEQAWTYVTPAEIHPQLCAFRKVYNDANPFFVMQDQPPVPVRARDTPLPVLTAAQHATLAADAAALEVRSYHEKMQRRYGNRIQLLRIPKMAAIIGVLMVISGLAQWDKKLMIIGACLGVPGIAITRAYVMLCAIRDREQAQKLAAIKQHQVAPMQRAVSLLNGSCVGYRWRVHDDPSDCSVQLFLDVLDPERLTRLTQAATLASETSPEPAVALDYPTGADAVRIEEVWPTAVTSGYPLQSEDTAVEIPPIATEEPDEDVPIAVAVAEPVFEHSTAKEV